MVLGVAYKKDVDDLRESPTLKIMQLLQGRGANVDYNDPYFAQLHRMRHYNYEGMKSVPLSAQTLGGYDGVIIATDHSTYDYNAIVDGSKLVVDTRNATRRVVRTKLIRPWIATPRALRQTGARPEGAPECAPRRAQGKA